MNYRLGVAVMIAGTVLMGACAPQRPETAAPEPRAMSQMRPSFEPRQYTVTFNTGSAQLSHEAENTIRQAAQYFKTGGSAVMVTGFTDTVGTERGNFRLSAERAEAVGRALALDGVPVPQIVARAAGETELAQATGPETPDRPNRRVTIDVQ